MSSPEPVLVDRIQILDEAKRIVTQDRNLDYGTPEQNFQRIATMWGAYKDEEFQAHDVAVMLAMVKMARIATSPQLEDHWIDIAGYAACGGEARPQAVP